MFFVENYLSDTVGNNVSVYGIFNADDISLDRCIDLASFKGKVTVLGRTILKHEILTVAERLSTLDMTTHKPQIFAIPSKILALDNTIVDRHVLGMPKGILGLEMRISDLHVSGVLEGILTGHCKIVYLHILALEEGIHRLQGNPTDLYVLTSPTKLLAIDIATRKSDILTLAQCLYTVEL